MLNFIGSFYLYYLKQQKKSITIRRYFGLYKTFLEKSSFNNKKTDIILKDSIFFHENILQVQFVKSTYFFRLRNLYEATN